MLNEFQKRVIQALEEEGLDPMPAAEAVGLNRQFINDLVTEKKASVGADKIDLLARALRSSPDWLRGVPGAERKPGAPQLKIEESEVSVPIIGTVSGSLGRGSFTLADKAVGYLHRPPGVRNLTGVYAFYVVGDSMAPVHPEGALRFADPNRPARPDDDVVLIIKPNANDGETAIMGRLKSVDATAVEIRKLASNAALRQKASTVEAIHRILTTNELFGL